MIFHYAKYAYEGQSVPRARHDAEVVLARGGVGGEVAERLLTCLSELVANSVEHGYPVRHVALYHRVIGVIITHAKPGAPVWLEVWDLGTGRVTVPESVEHAQQLLLDNDSERGRGLPMARLFATRMSRERGGRHMPQFPGAEWHGVRCEFAPEENFASVAAL